MTRKPYLIDVDAATFADLPCCGIKNPSHPGRQEKHCWLQSNAPLGLRAKTLLTPDGEPGGYIEYLPGEYAWRGVDARGYMFIHCIFVFSKRYQRKGWGRLMVDACVADAKKSGMSGVAVMVRDGPWLADRRLFLASGFELADTGPRDFELLARKFDPHTANPAFKTGWDEKVARYKKGLTIIRSSQCPHIAKFATDIARTAQDEFHIIPNVIDLKSPSDAQNAPTPYAVFAVIYKGRLLADRQISGTRFRNAMKQMQT